MQSSLQRNNVIVVKEPVSVSYSNTANVLIYYKYCVVFSAHSQGEYTLLYSIDNWRQRKKDEGER